MRDGERSAGEVGGEKGSKFSQQRDCDTYKTFERLKAYVSKSPRKYKDLL